MDAGMAAEGLSPLADDADARLGQAERAADRLPERLLLGRAQDQGRPEVAGRGRSRDPARLRKAGHSVGRAGGAGRRRGRAQDRGGRGVRQRLGRHHLPQGAGAGGGDLPLDLRGDPRVPGDGAQVAGQGRADARQLLRHAELRGVFRRDVCLHPRGRALPDGAEHLFPHQRREHRPVRAHADRRRQGRVCLVPRRLHRADARREPVARCRGGTGRARRCRDQVLDRAELVSGRRQRQGRDLQLRHQAGVVSGQAQQGVVDAGGNRLGDHVEVSVVRAQRRGFSWRVLLGGGDQQLPAGRHRHQDDPQRQGIAQHHRLQGDQRGAFAQHLSRAGARGCVGRRRAQLHPV